MGPSRPIETGTGYRGNNREQSATGSVPGGRSERTSAQNCEPRYAASAAGACIPLYANVPLEAQAFWRLIGDCQSEELPTFVEGGLSLAERKVRLCCTCLECTGKTEKSRARVSSTLASSPKCLSNTSKSESAEDVRCLTQTEQRFPICQTRLGVIENGSNTSD